MPPLCLPILGAAWWAEAGALLLGMAGLVAVPLVGMNWLLTRREAAELARGFGLSVPATPRRVMPARLCYRIVGRMQIDGRPTTFYVAALTPGEAHDSAARKGVEVASIREEWQRRDRPART